MKQKQKRVKNTISLMRMYCFSFWCNGKHRTATITARCADDAYEMLYARYPDAQSVEMI